MKAGVWASAFRVAHKVGSRPEVFELLVERLREEAEPAERVRYHPSEEVFTLPDGSKLLFDHDTLTGRVVFDRLDDYSRDGG